MEPDLLSELLSLTMNPHLLSYAEKAANEICIYCVCSLQSLVAVPCAVLASALTFSERKTRDLQETLQRVLDRREEERQSRELLQLYLKAVEKERGQDSQQAISQNAPDGIFIDTVRKNSNLYLKEALQPIDGAIVL